MKAILEFDLDDADDRRAHLRCVKATKMAQVLWEIHYNCHKGIEHRLDALAEKEKLPDAYDTMDLIFKEISELINEEGIIIDDLIV